MENSSQSSVQIHHDNTVIAPTTLPYRPGSFRQLNTSSRQPAPPLLVRSTIWAGKSELTRAARPPIAPEVFQRPEFGLRSLLASPYCTKYNGRSFKYFFPSVRHRSLATHLWQTIYSIDAWAAHRFVCCGLSSLGTLRWPGNGNLVRAVHLLARGIELVMGAILRLWWPGYLQNHVSPALDHASHSSDGFKSHSLR